ncbi:hypothetical protein [Amycolatopsis sp. SB7-3]|uniref:hypothetical protein n=1 Tax=Amycolatopsis sp. SB7-3 TaxID=3373438 RepID=UPI00374256C1
MILGQTAEQAVTAGADYGVLVQRRDGKSDPGDWWVWLPAGDLAALIETARDPEIVQVTDPRHTMPVRLELADLLPLLHAAGYGEP